MIEYRNSSAGLCEHRKEESGTLRTGGEIRISYKPKLVLKIVVFHVHDREAAPDRNCLD